MSRGPLAALLLLAFAAGSRNARAQTPRTDWLCSRAGDARQKLLVSFYSDVEEGKSRQCALFAATDDEAGMTSFRSCAIGRSVKPLFSASPVCSYEVDSTLR